jgi:hypothetical protein
LRKGNITKYYLAVILLLLGPALVDQTFEARAQRKTKSKSSAVTKPKVDELASLRDEYVKATRDFKSSLERLLTVYEKNVSKAEEDHRKSQQLFDQGLISKNQVEASAMAVTAAKAKVAETKQQMSTADTQIAATLLEAEAEAKLARIKIRRGGLVQTTSYVRFNGSSSWSLSDSWKVQQFFYSTFKRQLPIAVFGQGAIHERWRLDHRNSIDVSLHPDGAEGQALMNFLKSNGIPFLAFRGAIPGTATGPHIHIGRPSHRY